MSEPTLVERLRRCFTDTPAYSLRMEAANEIERLREELRGALCPGGGYTGQPPDEYPDVAACLKAGVCGCSLGAALSHPNQTEPGK